MTGNTAEGADSCEATAQLVALGYDTDNILHRYQFA